jgi:hypothetical protein
MAERRGTGWVVISGILLVLAGFNILFNGLWILHANTSIQNSMQGRLLFSDTDLDTWGWIYTIGGTIVLVAGFAVFGRAQWARWVGVLAAFGGMLISFLWLFTQYWPAAMVSIVLCGLVVYGLGTYGEPVEWKNPWVSQDESG